ESENIAARIPGLAFELFGGHVGQSSQDDAFPRQGHRGGFASGWRRFASKRATPTKVAKLDARLGHHDVDSLPIPMTHPGALCVIKGRTRFGGNLLDVRQWDRSLFQARRQRLAFENLHNQVLDAVVAADIEKGTDVWVLKLRDSARLALKALLPVRIVSLR